MDYHIFHNVEVSLSLIDRLLVLFGRKIHVEVKIKTDDANISVISTKTTASVSRAIFKQQSNTDAIVGQNNK